MIFHAYNDDMAFTLRQHLDSMAIRYEHAKLGPALHGVRHGISDGRFGNGLDIQYISLIGAYRPATSCNDVVTITSIIPI